MSNYHFFSSDIIYFTVLVSVELVLEADDECLLHIVFDFPIIFLENFNLCKSTRNGLK